VIYRKEASNVWVALQKRGDHAARTTDQQAQCRDAGYRRKWSGSLECVLWAGGPDALNQHLFKVIAASHPRWLCYPAIHLHLENFRQIASGTATTMGHIQRHHLSDARLAVPAPRLMRAVSFIIEPIVESRWAHGYHGW
jgi:type I restriction enzyme, S subunit